MNYKIALIRGDGIGPEIVNETVKVIDKVGERFGHTFEYVDVMLGGCATDAVGKSSWKELLSKIIVNLQ